MHPVPVQRRDESGVLVIGDVEVAGEALQPVLALPELLFQKATKLTPVDLAIEEERPHHFKEVLAGRDGGAQTCKLVALGGGY